MAKKAKNKELSPKEQTLDYINENFDTFVVAGFRKDNGTVDCVVTATSYADIQYLFSKGSFEMHLHQKAKELTPKETETND